MGPQGVAGADGEGAAAAPSFGSRFEELVYHLPPVGGHKLLLVLQTYCDESGIHRDSPVCVVAGFIGEARDWVALSGDWSRILADFELPELHAKDFFARDSTRRRVKPVRDWSDERADRFLDTLLAPVLDAPIEFVGISVHVADFLSLTENQRRLFTGGIWVGNERASDGAPLSPFFHAFQDAVEETRRLISPGRHAQLIFDSQNEFAPLALQQFQELQRLHDGDPRLGGLDFWRRAGTPALQLADLAAHLWYCGHRDAARGQRGRMGAEREHAIAALSKRWPGIKTWKAEAYAKWLTKCVPAHRADLFGP